MVVAVDECAKLELAILRTLTYYPNISKSMLMVNIRNSSKANQTLERLVQEGKVLKIAVLRETGRASVVYRLADSNHS